LKVIDYRATNFRNLLCVEHQPSPAMNIIVGDNAQGKTNLLEALCVLATGSSFRTNSDRVLVNDQAEAYELSSNYEYDQRCFETNIKYNARTGKVITLNGRKTNPHHPDRLRVVVFTPDDLYLVKGSPSRRRFFLDFLLKQAGAEYGYHLDNYVKILRKRNVLLKKNQANTKTFKLTTEVFVEQAVRLVVARIQMVNLLDQLVGPLYQDISGENLGGLKLRYAISFPLDSGKINFENLRISMLNHLDTIKEQECARKSSLSGPHREDINIYLNNHPARQFASQGQQRSIAVSLKLAELMAIQQAKGEFPVFLLDEVLSELDKERQQRLLEYLQKASFQSFLTTVNLEKNQFADSQASIYRMSGGKLSGKE
jgi:DNA replication and repair protein RecF